MSGLSGGVRRPHTEMATAVVGTHPTGMHSCLTLISHHTSPPKNSLLQTTDKTIDSIDNYDNVLTSKSN